MIGIPITARCRSTSQNGIGSVTSVDERNFRGELVDDHRLNGRVGEGTSREVGI